MRSKFHGTRGRNLGLYANGDHIDGPSDMNLNYYRGSKIQAILGVKTNLLVSYLGIPRRPEGMRINLRLMKALAITTTS